MHLIKHLPHWPWRRVPRQLWNRKEDPPVWSVIPTWLLGDSCQPPRLVPLWSPESSLWSSLELTLCMFYHIRLGWVRFYHLIWKHYRSARVTAFLLVFTRLCTTSWGNPSKMEANCVYFQTYKGEKDPNFWKYALMGGGRKVCQTRRSYVSKNGRGAFFYLTQTFF